MELKWKTIAAIFLIVVIALGFGCNKESGTNGDNNGNNITEVCVTTYTPQDITATTAVCGGDVIAPQGFPLSGIGVCWSTEHNPTIEDFTSGSETWNKPYVCQLRWLEPETKYYVRAFALRGLECYYGEEKNFTTEAEEIEVDEDDENNCPSISIMSGENYLYDGQTIDLNTDYLIGFRAASNSQTMKELATLKIVESLFAMDGTVVDSGETTFAISGTEYVYQGTLRFDYRELVGRVTISATVADVDGKTNSVTISLNINQPAVDLAVEDITWIKTGHNVQDLSAYGLLWKETNYKSPFTHILPAEGSTLYLVENGDQDFANIVTDIDLNNYFIRLTETSIPISDYNKVDCSSSANYHDLLIVKEANGKLHAINITHADITNPATGIRITITGKAK